MNSSPKRTEICPSTEILREQGLPKTNRNRSLMDLNNYAVDCLEQGQLSRAFASLSAALQSMISTERLEHASFKDPRADCVRLAQKPSGNRVDRLRMQFTDFSKSRFGKVDPCSIQERFLFTEGIKIVLDEGSPPIEGENTFNDSSNFQDCMQRDVPEIVLLYSSTILMNLALVFVLLIEGHSVNICNLPRKSLVFKAKKLYEKAYDLTAHSGANLKGATANPYDSFRTFANMVICNNLAFLCYELQVENIDRLLHDDAKRWIYGLKAAAVLCCKHVASMPSNSSVEDMSATGNIALSSHIHQPTASLTPLISEVKLMHLVLNASYLTALIAAEVSPAA